MSNINKLFLIAVIAISTAGCKNAINRLTGNGPSHDEASAKGASPDVGNVAVASVSHTGGGARFFNPTTGESGPQLTTIPLANATYTVRDQNGTITSHQTGADGSDMLNLAAGTYAFQIVDTDPSSISLPDPVVSMMVVNVACPTVHVEIGKTYITN